MQKLLNRFFSEWLCVVELVGWVCQNYKMFNEQQWIGNQQARENRQKK